MKRLGVQAPALKPTGHLTSRYGYTSEGSQASSVAGAPISKRRGLGGYADAKVSLKGAVPQKEGLGVQTMPKYDGTLPKVIASHVRPLALKV